MNRQQRLLDRRTASSDHEAMNEISREEVDLKLAAGRAEMDARLANVETVIKSGVADLRADLARQDAKFSAQDARFDQLRSEMHKNTTDIIKWFVGAGLTFATGIVAVLTVVVNNAIKQPQLPAAPQSPAVVVVPSMQQAPSPTP